MRLLARLAVLLLGLVPLVGCGPACNQLASKKETFYGEYQGTARGTRAPHMRLTIPASVVSDALSAAVAGLPKGKTKLSGLGELERYLPTDLSIVARHIALTIDRTDAARLDLDFDVKYEGQTLFGMELLAKAPVTYDPKNGQLRISIRADLFESVKPRIADDATEKLVGRLWSLVPPAARLVVPRSAVESVAKKSVSSLVAQAYNILRDQVLKDLGELAHFEVAFPNVPIESISVVSVGGADGILAFEVRTALPVKNGLPALSKVASSGHASDVRLEVAMQAVTGLGNWAMQAGKIPASFDKDGKALESGDFSAGAEWSHGERPLKVHVWNLKTEGMCFHARGGATPKLSYQTTSGASSGRLKVEIKDTRVEELEGPPLMKTVMDLTGLSESVFNFTKTMATGSALSFGTGDFKMSVQEIGVVGDVLVLALSMKRSTVAPTKARRRA